MVRRHLAALKRFEPIHGFNYCDHCKWMERVSDKEPPCIVCIYNANHIKEGLNVEMPEWNGDGRKNRESEE